MSSDPRIAFFDRHAPIWDTYGPPADMVLARLEKLRPQLPLTAGCDVLEVGCGTGSVTAWLAAAVAPGRVVAIDFAPAMLDRARARGGAAEYHCVDVCTADPGSARYDVIWCMNAFPHFRDPCAALEHLARALKSGGRLLILHLASWQTINAKHAGIGDAVGADRLPDPGGWRLLLAQAHLDQDGLLATDDLFLLTARRSAAST